MPHRFGTLLSKMYSPIKVKKLSQEVADVMPTGSKVEKEVCVRERKRERDGLPFTLPSSPPDLILQGDASGRKRMLYPASCHPCSGSP